MSSREALPDHLILLPDESTGRWALWRTACVRGAGFPAADVLQLADAACAAAADRLAKVEDETESLRQSALEALRGELETADKDRLDVLVKAIRKVKRSQPAKTEGLGEATATAITAWREAVARLEEEGPVYRAVFAEAEERLDRALREIAQEERFREAVTWQNPHAAETGLASFLRKPVGSGRGTARDRGHAQMLASYLQRYCTKNDTIGFFGPVGWARLGEGQEMAGVRCGPEMLAAREVYFEGWAIDAIADRLAQDEAMRPWLAPRLSPFLRREGNEYFAPSGEKFQLGPLSSALLSGCDGTRPARELIRGLGDLPADKEALLWGMLADLHAKGVLRWSFQIPLSLHPERTLRELLLAVEDEPLRERALALLDEMESARDAVSRAAGNAADLESALKALEETFYRSTGQTGNRGHGQLYAGRTLIFEDCRRDLDLTLGEPFLADLAPALSLILASARWITHFVATDHRERLVQFHRDLSTQTGSPQVSFLALSRVALPQIANVRIRGEIQRELNSRWERVFALPPGERRVHYRSEDLLPLVQREFSAPGPGWQKALCHSPDLLIAAPSLDAIRQGDYQAVLGEVHVAINSLDRFLFFSQHPHPEELHAAIESDLSRPCLIPVFSKVWNQDAAAASLGMWAPAVSSRMDVALRSEKDFYLDMSLDPPGGVSSSQLLPIGDLVVEPNGNGSLVVRPRDGRVSFDIIDFYQLVMMMQVLAAFRVLPSSTYTPRVTIDRLVVARESWLVPLGELEFAEASTPEERFAGARSWANRRGLPRFLFAKTPGEVKPFYADLESPVLVENLAKAIRKSALASPADATVLLSEMLPGHDQVWLPDAEGNHYTCELRIVVVDLE